MPRILKPFHKMTPDDYADIGLRCGLEVHRQLLTARKLFCHCPAGRYSEEYDAQILRHMRPTLSELGEYDGTALMEKKTRKNIYYRIHHDTVCTYEFDDTPPFFMDDRAVDTAIELALLLCLNLVDELHIARKQYLDGSIPAGFQRTTILGLDGWIPYKDRRIGIRQLGLEEDSCREVSDVGHDRVYLTDRLGMPLIEVVTEPDMRTPAECAEVCQVIRMLCLSTGRVRTGYGAARQDVNVSVRGGTRIEIKGVPQIGRIPRLIYNEAMRQCALLDIRELLASRGVSPDTFDHQTADVTRILGRTQYQPIRDALEQGCRVSCVVLKHFAGLLNHPTQEHTTFAKEFSDRVRVIACLTRLPNIIHSDNASDSLHGREWQRIRKKLDTNHDDALILVWGDERDTRTACEEIVIRARQATQGVPSDTRQAVADGTNGFERVLPGAERMYPDTDLPPLAIGQDRLMRIRARLPEYVWERQARFVKLGLPEDVIAPLCVSNRATLFDRIVDELAVDPVFVAVILCQRLKSFRRKGLDTSRLTDADIFDVFRAFADRRVAREGVVKVLQRLIQTPPSDDAETNRVDGALSDLNIAPASDQFVADRLKQTLRDANHRDFANGDQQKRFLMGDLMADLSGRTNATYLATKLAERLGGNPSLDAAGKVQA